MIFYCLDASAWVKRYVHEPGSGWIQDLFTGQPLVACASLGFLEAMATLSRKHKAGEISEIQLTDAIANLEHDWRRFIEIRLSAGTILIAA